MSGLISKDWNMGKQNKERVDGKMDPQHVRTLSFSNNKYPTVLRAFNKLVDETGLGAHAIIAKIAPMIIEDPKQFVTYCRSRGVKIG